MADNKFKCIKKTRDEKCVLEKSHEGDMEYRDKSVGLKGRKGGHICPPHTWEDGIAWQNV